MPAGQSLRRLLRRVVEVEPHEVRALLWSFAYFFCLLSSYYVLRPLRDAMAIEGGVRNLQWLFTATFLAMLCAVPLYGWAVARFPRRRLVPWIYRVFLIKLLLFFLLFGWDEARLYVARAFYVWVSLFNLFVVSVFWSFMADLWRNDQARRLFGFVAAGGSLGALLGPVLTASLAVPLGPVNLLLVSAVLLEVAAQCVGRLRRAGPIPPDTAGTTETPDGGAAIGGGIFAGLTGLGRSPYLLGVAGFILLYTTTSTFLYFQQAHIVAAAFDDTAARTRLFATIDLIVALLTIAIQCGATGRLMRWLGVGGTLAVLPIVTFLGFLALALSPVLGVLVAFQALRRAANFAVSRPAREVLFTVVGAEEKYKAKNVIDTLVYRGGDAASGWLFTGLSSGLGLGLGAIALVTLPLAGLWIALALLLGRAQQRMAQAATA